MYQDALRVYAYLHKSGKYDFADKISEIKAKSDPNYDSEVETEPLSKKLVSLNQEIDIETPLNDTVKNFSRDEVGFQENVLLAEYDSLINLLFKDEEKSYFKIVPSEEFYFNQNDELVTIFTEHKDSKNDSDVEDVVENKFDQSYKEILESSNDINPEVTVEDFVNILYTYYSKDTKISEIKIGDLFLLLSSIKLENS